MPFAGISHVGLAAVGTTRSVRTVSQEGLRAGGVRQGIPAMDGSESKNTKIIFAAALAVACWGILLSAVSAATNKQGARLPVKWRSLAGSFCRLPGGGLQSTLSEPLPVDMFADELQPLLACYM